MRIVFACFTFLAVSTPLLFAAEPIIITAPAEPPLVETWTLEEVWRIDAEDPDAPLMGVPKGGLVAPSGEFMLLDYQLSQVLVLSPEGEFVKTLSREGEGPGELNKPGSMFMVSDSILGIVQFYPAKIIQLLLDGTPLSTIQPAGGDAFWNQAKIANGAIFVTGSVTDYSTPSGSKRPTRHFLSRISDEGETLHTFREKTVVTDWNNPLHDEAKSFFSGNIWDICADGTLVIATNRDQYRLEFISAEGKLLRVIERPFTPHLRTKEELADLKEGISYYTDGKKMDVKCRFLPNDGAIAGIDVHDDGTIWITSCYGKRNLPPGIARRYDVFEADGTFRSEVQIAFDYDSERDGFNVMEDGSFLYLQNITGAYEALSSAWMQDDEQENEITDEDEVELSIVRLVRAN